MNTHLIYLRNYEKFESIKTSMAKMRNIFFLEYFKTPNE